MSKIIFLIPLLVISLLLGGISPDAFADEKIQEKISQKWKDCTAGNYQNKRVFVDVTGEMEGNYLNYHITNIQEGITILNHSWCIRMNLESIEFTVVQRSEIYPNETLTSTINCPIHEIKIHHATSCKQPLPFSIEKENYDYFVKMDIAYKTDDHPKKKLDTVYKHLKAKKMIVNYIPYDLW